MNRGVNENATIKLATIRAENNVSFRPKLTEQQSPNTVKRPPLTETSTIIAEVCLQPGNSEPHRLSQVFCLNSEISVRLLGRQAILVGVIRFIRSPVPAVLGYMSPPYMMYLIPI